MAVIQRTKDFGEMPPVVSDRVFGVYARPDVGDLTFVGTTAPFDGEVDHAVESERPADEEHVHNQAERFLRRWPSQQAASLREGFSGVYDCSADLQPLLGPIPNVEGLYIACGFSGHGFKLSPVIGELMADKVLGNPSTPVDIAFFDPARFLRNEPIKMTFSYSSQTL
jgi:sarcosine oxidase subunit beta